ncbi:MAG: AAA family ATPase [Clostridiales bacterium]|nr:AAA family ATPase [Clostridiales bacterium]
MFEQEKATVPIPPVRADGEQPIQKNTKQSVSDDSDKINDEDYDFEKIQRQMERLSDPSFMPTFSMRELYENVYDSRPPIIDGLFYAGTYLFVGAPKVGKSFLMAQLAYHVSMGYDLWTYSVKKGTVLYLALEDTQKRLQERLFRMYGTDSTENLHFTICAKQLGNGLDEQLIGFVKEHPDTKLIIIDTLQKIREAGSEKFSYATDYDIVGRLKRFADSHHICLLLVHHTRKQQADDKFDMISGTNGLLGAADGAFLLQKEKRTSDSATLDISGRDQQDQRLHLTRDLDRLIWNLEKAETELWIEPPDPILEAVAVLVTAERPEWSGTPTELVERLGIDMKPNVLSMQLNVKAGRLLNEHQVRYESSRSHAGRNIKLTLFAEA